jgi:5-(carboxyamino)imidazole ribonucleotide synthase
MERLFTSNLKLGIIAGGQLGKMLIQEASRWDITTLVMDPEENCPAGSIATHSIVGSPQNYEDVYNFGKKVDVLTFELENVNVEALRRLKAEGLCIAPDPDVLELIQDKGLQKQLYSQKGFPTAPFKLYEDKQALLQDMATGVLTLPFVQKLRKGGYDGRGVAVIRTQDDVATMLEGPCLVEDLVDLHKEIAVIAARNIQGDVRSFPVVEMAFDPKANLVEKLICPAELDVALAVQAQEIAEGLVRELNMVGVLAVEFFLDAKGELLVNEVAPRPHNSGHHTIESVITSQYEQHLRCVLGLPLGSTRLKMPAVMLNLLGEPGYAGPVRYEGVAQSMALEGVKVHLYGKKYTRPMRKMGHVTIIAPTLEAALEKADQVKDWIKVVS